MRETESGRRLTERRWHGVVLAALGFSAIGGGLAAAAIPTGNLIQNAGAEQGIASDDGLDDLDVPLWQDGGKFTVVEYGASGFPTAADSASIGGGNDLFAGGPDGAKNVAWQRVVLPASSHTEIDSEAVTARLSGYLGGFASQGDNMVVQALFKGATGTTLGQVRIGPVTPAHRGGATKLLPRTQSAGVPAGTRAVVVRQIATRVSGTYNDGYADKLILRLTSP